MDNTLRDWIKLSALLGLALVLGGLHLATRDALPYHRAGIHIATAAGAGLLVLVALVVRARGTLGAMLRGQDLEEPGRVVARPWLTLFLASFVGLFLELALIRYTGSQLRVFSFYKNVPLVAAYLGLGIGCALGGGQSRHVVRFLLWFVPLSVLLAEGTFLFAGALGQAAAVASSEHILGDAAVREVSELQALAGQAGMGAVCVLALVALATLFIPLGRLLGDAFERVPRLTAYTINLLGSLVGTGMFLLLGYLWTPPWVWMLIGLGPLIWWLGGWRQRVIGSGLILLATLAVMPSIGDTVWSPYQKLVGQQITVRADETAPEIPGYLVDISDVFYQIAVDLRPEAVARAGRNPYPHYDEAFRALLRPIRRVLIVGAGTGNDVAAALRAGAAAVDAVDIDPAIVALGRLHHPEQPYDDPRVHVIIDDARAAFHRLPAGTYDAVLFGLLDSHTQLGMSSVRLDNYVFTQESFAAARRLLRPGGRIVVTAATFRDWFRQRISSMLEVACASPVEVREQHFWTTYDCQPQLAAPSDRVARVAGTAVAAGLPTDDWPFLYLPDRSVPRAYAFAIVLLFLGSALVVRSSGLSPSRFGTLHGHLFFLGAAFLLMEVYAINRLALLFGTTWVVAAVAIIVVLILIVAANLTAMLVGELPYMVAYACLVGSLLLSFLLSPETFVAQGLAWAVAYAFLALLPVYFAGLIFARSFARALLAGPAIGANMLGAVLGGWTEYASMALGIRALALLALVFYLGSLVCLWRGQRTSVA